MRRTITTALAALSLTATAAAADLGPAAAAVIKTQDGQRLGEISLTQTSTGVFQEVTLSGLSATGHGFHIHETGACDGDFKSAGGHFNPHGAGHGHAVGDMHAGDLPNIYGGADGAARIDLLVDRVSLTGGAANLFDADGSAFIIHAKPDTYGEEAGAGARLACGVIERL